ncbi:MAG: twin-arginine translocation signal domain-containing protein [Chloroflexi bacterium]|nr:twin-arginine translocation signal domain-containing protein [Chloroflexota bacterium]
MSKELNQTGQSRRSFLVKLGLGVTALAGVSTGLLGLSKKARNQEFPGPDSIFHPAQDPRTDPRRR